MKRAIVTLTPAEQSFLRGAIRSYSEDMRIAALITGSESDMADRLFTKINAAPLVDLPMWAKSTVRRIIVNHGKVGSTLASLTDIMLQRIGELK